MEVFLWLTHVLVLAADVFCILNHPVQSVQIMGDVVSLQQKSLLVEYKGIVKIGIDPFFIPFIP